MMDLAVPGYRRDDLPRRENVMLGRQKKPFRESLCCAKDARSSISNVVGQLVRAGAKLRVRGGSRCDRTQTIRGEGNSGVLHFRGSQQLEDLAALFLLITDHRADCYAEPVQRCAAEQADALAEFPLFG